LSRYNLAGLLPENGSSLKIAASRDTQAQWALEGHGKDKTPMTSDRCQKKHTFLETHVDRWRCKVRFGGGISDGSVAMKTGVASVLDGKLLGSWKKAGRVNEEKGKGLAASPLT
jgi:hypothetical protein